MITQSDKPLRGKAPKEIVVRSVDWPAGEAFAKQADIVRPVFESADAKEGARAFAEKRDPVWRGV